MSLKDLRNTNLFKHSPKELVTDGFLAWLFYLLDSDKRYDKLKMQFFNELLLKENDIGKNVKNIEVAKQVTNSRGRADLILSFKLNDIEQKILFENKTWSSTTEKQLGTYKKNNPNLYKYIYLKLGYVNYFEKKLTKKLGYEIIDVFKLSNALTKLSHLHLFIEHYLEYINKTFKDYLESFETELFENKNYNILWDRQTQQFLISKLYEKLDGKIEYLYFKHSNNKGGSAWTQLDIAKNENLYNGIEEYIFWRIDKRSGKYYIRLNQYADINIKKDNDNITHKRNRLQKLREIARNINSKYKLKEGKLSNKGTKESEIIIFFFRENDLNKLMEALPNFSLDFVEEYKKV